MAGTCLLLPRAILTNSTSKNRLNAPNPSHLPSQSTLNTRNTSVMPIGCSQSMGTSLGYISESRLPIAISSIGLVRAVSEDGIPTVSESGIDLQGQAKDNGSSLVGCKGCGRPEIQKGCNGEGRIQGGIGTIPGFTWWPIKAYRPCPSFVASGGRYKRQGQTVDEVAFGKKGKD